METDVLLKCVRTKAHSSAPPLVRGGAKTRAGDGDKRTRERKNERKKERNKRRKGRKKKGEMKEI